MRKGTMEAETAIIMQKSFVFLDIYAKTSICIDFLSIAIFKENNKKTNGFRLNNWRNSELHQAVNDRFGALRFVCKTHTFSTFFVSKKTVSNPTAWGRVGNEPLGVP